MFEAIRTRTKETIKEENISTTRKLTDATMKLTFSKYQATGNDFIMISDPKGNMILSPDQCTLLCDRRFGIGADGVIIVKKSEDSDFEVLYYNPDGSQSLCGNGSRAAVMFAAELGLLKKDTTSFLAYDGKHTAEIIGENVHLKMSDVHNVREMEDGMFIDTGSPHLVRFVPDVDSADVTIKGRELRNSLPVKGGANINFVQKDKENSLKVRTYERGVERETLSCGTGVTASALAASYHNRASPVEINTRGGKLSVSFVNSGKNKFTDIYLTGPAKRVFSGNVILT